MATGRNAPCTCGSGRKYKYCCGRVQQSEIPPEAARLGALMRQCTADLHEHAGRVLGAEGMAIAWAEFWNEDPPAPGDPRSAEVGAEIFDSPYIEVFLTWFLLHWRTDPLLRRGPLPRPDTIAADYLENRGRRMSTAARVFLDAWRREPLSYFEVTEIWPGKGSMLRDLVLDRQLVVHDEATSQSLSRWDVVLAQVVGVRDTYILGCLAPYVVKRDRMPSLQSRLDRIRRKKPGGPEELLAYDLDLIMAYHKVDPGALPVMPQLRNTDGHEIVICETKYRVSAGCHETVRDWLVEQFEEEPLLDEDGAASHDDPMLQFVWLGPARGSSAEGPTLLGSLSLTPDALKVSTNSRERDATIRERIEAALGSDLSHVTTSENELDADALQREGALGSVIGLEPEERPAELEAIEVEFMQRAIRRWADEPVPALGDITPREATKTKKGRAAVEDLIRGWENLTSAPDADAYRASFDQLRDDLGLQA